MNSRAFCGALIFDGRKLHHDQVLIVSEGHECEIVPSSDMPCTAAKTELDGGTIVPGFIDLQVNGGGGVQFNQDPSVKGLEAIAAAHRNLGTAFILPTLITDTLAQTEAAINAVVEAVNIGVPGIAGLHLEGPHLAPQRAGAHDPHLMRSMDARDEEILLMAVKRLPNLMITIAPEQVSPEQISRLSREGVIVSLGHSDCTYSDAMIAFDAGASCVTHLFNAMSQLGSRAPGLVGAALAKPGIAIGLIADGIHIHPETIGIAARSRTGTRSIFLVTDAMATAGSDIDGFKLGNRWVGRVDGHLTLENGTLAGADLDLPTAVKVMVERVGLELETALRMVTRVPASVLKPATIAPPVLPGRPVGLMHLSKDYEIRHLA